jgi:3-deoxy-D-manno-octulosonic-acid transferase
VVITFFSPSGYEIRKDYNQADLILYLPKDSSKNAKLVLNSSKPSKIFFIKYEFWPHYLLEAKSRSIPTYLVSGVFRKKQIFFRWYGGYMRDVLKSFKAIFLQDKNSQSLLRNIKISGQITGDTRYDRVMQNAQKVEKFPLIESFIDEKKTIVIGSCWAEDEAIIFPVLNNRSNVKIIIAPHEIDAPQIKSIISRLKKKVLKYSEIEDVNNIQEFDVLIIDNIGILMHLYQFADLAYIGGAFGKGLHNILEPASFGVPVIFGENYAKFPEAFQFIDAQIGFSIKDCMGFEKIYDNLCQTNISKEVLRVMNNKVGATDKIISNIFVD